MLTLRPMELGDLELVDSWLAEPHVAAWYSPREKELAQIRRGVLGSVPTHLLVVEEDTRPIGWCQWYMLEVGADDARDVDARPGDVGIDYAIGEAGWIGRGVGTLLIERLVDYVRVRHPGAGIVVDPDASNAASRRVLEKCGFALVDVRVLGSSGVATPTAIYRLDGVVARSGTVAGPGPGEDPRSRT
jgi:RimJ/RimL family protein N-acetyltransferase